MVGLPPFRNNYRLIKVCLRDRTVYKDRIKEYSFVGSYYVSFSYYNYILHSFRSLGDIYVFLFLNIVSFFLKMLPSSCFPFCFSSPVVNFAKGHNTISNITTNPS